MNTIKSGSKFHGFQVIRVPDEFWLTVNQPFYSEEQVSIAARKVAVPEDKCDLAIIYFSPPNRYTISLNNIPLLSKEFSDGKLLPAL